MRSQMTTAYQMRFVYTPEARNHEEVGRFHNYVDKQVRETTGYNTGYSRWMDEHYAITIANAQDLYLDQVRWLCPGEPPRAARRNAPALGLPLRSPHAPSLDVALLLRPFCNSTA